VAWGDNSHGQTNTPSVLDVKLIAAGGNQNMVSIFSPFVQYPIDVSKDLLLVCNNNSTSSAALRDYYLAHRPLVANANVLNVTCDTGEFTTTNNCESQIITPILNWLNANPTKHPEYILFFFDIPTRFYAYPPNYGSVSYRVHLSCPGWKPFVNYINAGTLADCEAYVDKLASFATNYSPGKLVISAYSGGYGNTNFIIDDVKNVYCGSLVVSKATNGLSYAGVLPGAISFLSDCEGGTDFSHLTNAADVAAYISWGEHSSLGGGYATNDLVQWSGNSRWWIIETIESFNGQRAIYQGDFVDWFTSNSFGGSNYSATPIGAVSHTEEGIDAAFETDPLQVHAVTGHGFGHDTANEIVGD
jgi:hypothetical protein